VREPRMASNLKIGVRGQGRVIFISTAPYVR
jgi:hypothetical protein